MPSHIHHFTPWSNSGEDFDIDHQLAGVPLPEGFLARTANSLTQHRVNQAIRTVALPPKVVVRLRRRIKRNVRDSASLST